MKAKIVYKGEDTYTTIDSPGNSFLDFCKELFEKKIYISINKKPDRISVAINTENILFVEEVLK